MIGYSKLMRMIKRWQGGPIEAGKVVRVYNVLREHAPEWLEVLDQTPTDGLDQLDEEGEDILDEIGHELMPQVREVQIKYLSVLKRQRVWVLPHAGDIGITELIANLKEESIPFRITRKSLQKAHRKLKKIYETKYCTGQLPSPKVYPSSPGWYQLLSQQEYKTAASHMGNCLWWSYWCRGEEGRGSHKRVIIYYNPSKRVMIAFDTNKMVVEDAEGPRGQIVEDFTPGQMAAYEDMVAEIESRKRAGEYVHARAQALNSEIRAITRSIAQENPRKDKRMKPLPKKYAEQDIYDPREESIRAVDRGAGFSLSRGAFVKKHEPEWIIQRSWERYQQPDKLIRKRQQYEVMLSRGRRYGTFRVTAEPTRKGVRYFVWPLVSRQRVPKAYASEAAAVRRADELNEKGRSPARSLPRKAYTKAELADWLPPASVFRGRSGVLTGPGKKELGTPTRRRSVPSRSQSRRNPMTKEQMQASEARSQNMREVQKRVAKGDIIGLAIAMAMGPHAYYMDVRLADIDFARLEADKPWGGPSLYFSNVTFDKVSFRGAQLKGAEFRGCVFVDTTFVGADLSGAEFLSCSFRSTNPTNFTGAQLSGTKFSRCYLHMDDQKLYRVSLSRAVKTDLMLGLDPEGPQVILS